MAKTEFFTEPDAFNSLVNIPGVQVREIEIISEDLIKVVYLAEDGYVEALGNTSTMIAAFVTAQARLHLYSYLKKLGERVFYFGMGVEIF